jgi:large subunit ribosomal protein L28
MFDVVECAPSHSYLTEEEDVARSCEICGKAPKHGRQVSHAHNVSSRVWYPNVQRLKVVVGKARRRLRVCTRCLRSGRVVKAASARSARTIPA